MPNFNSLNVAMCQMNVVPGRPDINAKYIIDEIRKAAKRGVDIIAFPEMCVTGYLIGDVKYEDASFIADVLTWNQRIIDETAKYPGLVVIFGTLDSDFTKKGEDGRRPRKYNVGIVAQNGQLVGRSIKTLQPDYRFFNDDKHMYPMRKVIEEENELRRVAGMECVTLADYLKPYVVSTRLGEIKLGVILCEDMWDGDYAFSPTRVLVNNGAEIVFNLSASPWGWQKNRKRHQVVKDLLRDCHVPFVYVNNTGVQNPGKNIVMFDGSSTAYDENGDIIFDIPPYKAGTTSFTFGKVSASKWAKAHAGIAQSDIKELFDAAVCGLRAMVSMLPPGPIFVGLSGGIDSAVVAALLVHVLGPDRVIAVNMPSDNNSQKTKDIARQIAENLGIQYWVRPVGGIVEASCEQTGNQPHTLGYENEQARARMLILAGLAGKYNGAFPCDANEVELAFGYGTLNGDLAGFYAPLGDMTKREVRQIAEYLNRVIFGREVIPQECIDQIPSAELDVNQFDPFDYGDANRRGYHDEMVRAFKEFSLGAQWILERYMNGTLEKEMLLDDGTLKRLFPTAKAFVKDLERCWTMFQRYYFKRIQSVPNPVYSKRAFGRDKEESMMFTKEPHYTLEYKKLKRNLLRRKAT